MNTTTTKIQDNHKIIYERLEFFHKNNKIPHIIFHGESGSGKRYIVDKFIHLIYNSDRKRIKNNVMTVNCAHGKGIKFIRDELKFFAKTNIQSNTGASFKTITLINADFLTIDAQSALRRCIELFSHNTRFFIIVKNKQKLLYPILSRFCEIYIPEFIEKNEIKNLHQYLILDKLPKAVNGHIEWLNKNLDKEKIEGHMYLMDLANDFYQEGYSCLELIEWIRETKTIDEILKNEIIICFDTIKSEFRCEKLLILYLLDYLFLRSKPSLKSVFSI